LSRARLNALCLCAVAALAGCQRTQAPVSLGQRLADAHGLDHWRRAKGLSGAVRMDFLDPHRPHFYANFLFDAQSSRVRMGISENWETQAATTWTTLGRDDRGVWVSPAKSQWKNPGGTLHAWPLLITLPFKLTEPGATLSEPRPRKLGAIEFMETHVTFADGQPPLTILFDAKSNLIALVAFGPELARELEPAYDKPAAITFYGYQEVEGIIIPALWRLWNWSDTDGILGRPIGEGSITRLELAYPSASDFSRPTDARQ
jgi:hypothetical protein